MRRFITSDGFQFFELSDGSIVDSLDPDKVDLSFEGFEDFHQATEGDYIVTGGVSTEGNHEQTGR